MSKQYLVLYNSSQSYNYYRKQEPTDMFIEQAGNKTGTLYTLAMQVFDDEQEAADFAKKKDGFIVIPAQIQSKVLGEA